MILLNFLFQLFKMYFNNFLLFFINVLVVGTLYDLPCYNSSVCLNKEFICKHRSHAVFVLRRGNESHGR